ncbi:MAG: putative toxin-antitoxin system toxin component, PIN family [bacterium]
MKIVLDSNVIVSAFASRGLCSSLFEVLIAKEQVITSEHILSEVSRVLRSKIKLPEKNTREIIDFLGETTEVTAYGKMIQCVSRDKDDDEMIALAVASKSKLIITGDKDLLVLKKHKNIRILSPKQYWLLFLS